LVNQFEQKNVILEKVLCCVETTSIMFAIISTGNSVIQCVVNKTSIMLNGLIKQPIVFVCIIDESRVAIRAVVQR
jgi:hypothetical protein